MFQFENPGAFKYLFLIPLFLFVAWFFSRRVHKKLSQFFGARLTPFLTKSLSVKKRRWKLILQSIVLLLFVIALARPQIGMSVQEVKSEGFELLVMIDVSESMTSEDVKPNRLEQAKAEISRLMDNLAGSRVGIIAFAGSAVLISPLSTDPSALKMYVESLGVNSVSSQGTNFEKALRVAKDAFDRGGAEKDSSTAVTRAILIASDGEDHEPGALKYAEELTKTGIRIFALAYGSEKGGPIPVRDKMGFLKSYKKDPAGQTIITSVKGDELQKLASAGKGNFYFAMFGGHHMSDLMTDFNQLEKSQFESQVATQYDENFQIILLFGILLAILELLLGERRTGFKIWKGRFEVPPA